MRHKPFTLLVLISLLFLAACATNQSPKSSDSESEVIPPPAIQNYNAQMAAKDIPKDANARQATLAIKGMTCPSCALGVEYQLKQLDGVYNAKIKYPEGTGLVVYDASKISAEKIAQASTIYPAAVISDEPYEQ